RWRLPAGVVSSRRTRSAVEIVLPSIAATAFPYSSPPDLLGGLLEHLDDLGLDRLAGRSLVRRPDVVERFRKSSAEHPHHAHVFLVCRPLREDAGSRKSLIDRDPAR